MVYDKNHPFPSRLIQRERLSGKTSKKDVYLLTFDTHNGELSYQTGDWLAVLPKNSMKEVERLLLLLNATGEEQVKVKGIETAVSLKDAFYKHLNITQVSRALAQWVQSKTSSELQQAIEEVLQVLTGAFVPGYTVADFLKAFALGADFSAQELVDQLRGLSPRMYSIASSPNHDKGRLNLIVASAPYTDCNSNLRYGVSSSYLNHRVQLLEDVVSVYVVSSRFRLPEDAQSDIILVGPGAGLAPFRGFLQEREYLQKNTTTLGRSWLFFGDQHRASDFLCEEELKQFQQSGILARLDLAFSRDQIYKIYVQDRIKENAIDIWKWIQNGAYFYICGDKRMAKDVESALIEIFITQGELSADDAAAYLKDLKTQHRFHLDVY